MNINMHDSTDVSARKHDITVFYTTFRMHYVVVVNFGFVHSCAWAARAEWLSFSTVGLALRAT
jgi:hypothetical protein